MERQVLGTSKVIAPGGRIYRQGISIFEAVTTGAGHLEKGRGEGTVRLKFIAEVQSIDAF